MLCRKSAEHRLFLWKHFETVKIRSSINLSHLNFTTLSYDIFYIRGCIAGCLTA